MKSIKHACAMAWQHDSDGVGDAREERRVARERVYRTALHRVQGATVAPVPPAGSKLAQEPVALARVTMTTHAAHRLKNRGITLEQLLAVADFGVPQRAHGATRFALDRKARQLLGQTIPPALLKRLGSLDIVAVFADDGALITASHRTERLRREITRH